MNQEFVNNELREVCSEVQDQIMKEEKKEEITFTEYLESNEEVNMHLENENAVKEEIQLDSKD